MKKEKAQSGSVQVIEFSYVLPIALAAVIGLVYVTFLLFFYAYSYCVVEHCAEDATRLANQSNRVYWQLSDSSLDGDKRKQLEENLQEKASRMEVLPGLRFISSFEETGKGIGVLVKIQGRLFGKELFLVQSKKVLYFPWEFAKNVDLTEEVLEESDMISFLKERYQQYINKDKTYEIF